MMKYAKKKSGMISETGSGTGLPENVIRNKVSYQTGESYGEYGDTMQSIDKRIKKEKSKIKKNKDY